MTRTAVARRRAEYWDWLAVALFLLLSVDLLTTLGAARVVGTGAEANPVMHWALGQGLWAVVALNLVVLVLTVVLFAIHEGRLEVTRPPFDRYAHIGTEIWLGILVAAGLAIFANNLSVIVFQHSLF